MQANWIGRSEGAEVDFTPVSYTHLLHEQMLANYRALYDETARAFDLPREGE